MFPQFYGNNVNQGDQSQSNQIKRQDQGYRPDLSRQQQVQSQYSSMNMNPALVGQQFDTRFLPGVNPGINPNSAIQYSMIPNIYNDGVKSMQIPYDRGVVNYQFPMQMVGMHQNVYGSVNPYYQYYGLRQGVPLQNVDRAPLQGYGVEYSVQNPQEKQQPVQVANPQSSVQTSAVPTVVKQESTPEAGDDGQPSSTQQNIKQEPELAKDISPVKEEPAPQATSEMTDDIQLAKMLLQIKGKSKEPFAANTMNPHFNEVNQNRMFAHSLIKPEEKRPHLNENPYDLSNYMMYSGYPPQSLPMSSTVKQPFNPQYPLAQSRYPNFYTQPTHLPQATQAAQNIPPMQSAPNVQPANLVQNASTQAKSVPPPIPSPSPLHKVANPLPIGDYYVFCTVCRHGTPININVPIPDTFKCANCGFVCQLDKHFLSYYNYPDPNDKSGEEGTNVKAEDEQPVQTKAEATEEAETEKMGSAPKATAEQTEQTVQTEQGEKPTPIIQVKNEEMSDALPIQEISVKAEPVESAEPAEPVEPAESSPIDIDEVVCTNFDKNIPIEILRDFAARGEFEEGKRYQELTQEDLHTLKQQCVSKPNEWWIGKFVNIEIPASLVNEEETKLKDEADEADNTQLLVLGEVVGISETGFVVRLVEGDGKKTITITNLISNTSKCWVILKEGYLNLRVC